MIIMPVPKDVRSFKPKFMGPFTKREAIGVGCAVALVVITYAAIAPFSEGMTMTQQATIAMVPAAIPLAFGFIDVQDMPIWVYGWNMIVQNFLAPRHRVYKTANIFQEFAVRNKIRMEDLDDEVVTTAKERKRKKKEYEAKLKEFVQTFPEYQEFK